MTAVIIRKRKDFFYLSKEGKDAVMPAFVLKYAAPVRKFHANEKSQPSPDGVRIGYVVRKKIGGAVERNFAKRRLREIMRANLPNATPGLDYVLIARMASLTRNFSRMKADLADCFKAIKKERAP